MKGGGGCELPLTSTGECAPVFTDQLSSVDSPSVKPNARFAWNIKCFITEPVVNACYLLGL